MDQTDRVSACLLRLPLWLGMDERVADVVAEEIDAL
jgi:hypothetical protein